MSNRFVHLHLHSEYSLQDSTIRLKPLIDQVRERDMGAVALTDLNNMFAVVKHFKAATAMGVKPIFGADLWIRHPERKDQLSRLVLLCQNDEGYLNLKKLVSRAYLEGQSADRATLQIEWLREASDGLIALSACLDGDIGLALRAQNSELAESCLQQWLDIFGNRFFLELQRTGRAREEAYIAQAISWSESLQVPVVATNDVRFIDADDFDAHEVRVCICTGFTLDDQRRPRLYSPQQYLRSADEMVELFADIPEAISNSVAIASACNLRLELGQACLPEYPVPEEHSTNSYLRHVSEQGLERRLDFLRQQLPEGTTLDREPYDERLKIELDVIIEMGFPGYFLIVMDFIAWAKGQSIPVGPGRGSGAGSLVAYALDITDLDPLEYELLFERFLNPERVSMPDFDIDFCMDRRDEVIDYVADHYGRNQVSQIITYGSMAAKAVIRDVGRVMSHPYGFVDRIAKLVPFEVGITLDKALQQEEALLELYQQEEEVTMLIDMARSLEGLTRNVGKHAGGVVISPSDLTDFTPLYCEQGGGGLVSQYDKDDVEAVGLVKFDFLGLRTLTIIDWAVRAINARGDGEKLEIERIPLNDVDSIKLLQAYQTTAVFQLESRGMKDLIRRLQPDSFEDIIALVALFRPGPLQSGMVDDFIDRKHGRSRVEYPHPALEVILKPTYGVILYQEQVMQIAQVLAGYSLGEADMLRRAMGKKKPEEMEKQRVVFTEGAVANEVEEATATYIFDLMEKFAGYGFNKSHSAAYALVSYQTAWLKAHYPAEFMAAVLSADMDNTDKIVTLIDECRSMKLDIRSPDINRSNYQFTAGDEGEVYYGLGAIKGVGKAVIESIIETRATQPYRSLDDFCKRIDSVKSSRKLMDALIKGGAMDCFSDNRAALMGHLPYALQAADQRQKNLDAGISDMFDCLAPAQEVEPELPDCLCWDEKQRLTLEKEALGLFLTGHPLAMVEAEIGQFAPTRLGQWLEKLDIGGNGGGNGNGGGERFRHKEQDARVCGLVVDIRMRNSFRGREAFVTLDDRSGRVDVRVLPDLLAQIEPIIQKDLVWVVDGGIAYDDFNNGIKLRADKVQLLDDFRVAHARALHIRLNGQAEQQLQAMIEVLEDYRASGAMPVVFHLRREDYNYQLRTQGGWSLKPDEQCLLSLQRCLGQAEFYFEYR